MAKSLCEKGSGMNQPYATSLGPDPKISILKKQAVDKVAVEPKMFAAQVGEFEMRETVGSLVIYIHAVERPDDKVAPGRYR